MRTKKYAFALIGLLASGSAVALPVNGTGLVTPDVIFGAGNANGSFTGVNQNNVELGLRGKLRYNNAGNPENTFNYDGDRTYTFLTTDGNAPSNRSIFNFEWSINVDPFSSTGNALDDLTYLLNIDLDPSAAASGLSFDPINVPFADHALGTNATANGGGTSAGTPGEYATLIASNNVAQNSSNLGFFAPVLSPQTPGIYTFGLSAISGNQTVASTSIDIVVSNGQQPVPVPATLYLLGMALAGLAWNRRPQSRQK